jgi:hypothetical protein
MRPYFQLKKVRMASRVWNVSDEGKTFKNTDISRLLLGLPVAVQGVLAYLTHNTVL